MPEFKGEKFAVRIQAARLYTLPVEARTPYHFGQYVLREVDCLRVAMVVERVDGACFTGWGETPLSVGWAWPGGDFMERLAAMKRLVNALAKDLVSFGRSGHAFEVGHAYQEERFHTLREKEGVPYLAGLVCLSAFDLALYDAYGKSCDKPIFETLGRDYLKADLSGYLQGKEAASNPFAGKFPTDYLKRPADALLPAWHAVGGGDPLDSDELKGTEPDDEYPVLLKDWIVRDGLDCLKIKLSGQNFTHDYERICKIGRIANETGVKWLCTDFNSTVREVSFVTELLDQLAREEPQTYEKILYVEQPFFYEMDESPKDVHAVSERKPLYMDESAHDWKLVREGFARGWTGVALKTCKTLTSALLMLCWAREHKMGIMVQDLTNPMLAQITHAQLAAHAGTVMGLETNSMQFYPTASASEERVHPGLFQRRGGRLDLSTVSGPGFGYRLDEIDRQLPGPDAVYSA